MTHLTWGGPALSLSFMFDDGSPVVLTEIAAAPGGAVRLATAAPDGRTPDPHRDQPLVEISAFGHGRFPGGFRHVDTVIGRRLRYVSHNETAEPVASEWGGTTDVRRLRITQHDADTGLDVTSVFEVSGSVAGFRTWTVVRGTGHPLVLDFVSTFASGAPFDATGLGVDELSLVSAASDWVAESRWTTRPLREIGLARIDRALQHHQPRSRCVVTNRGAWSTGEALPTGVLLPTPRDAAAPDSAPAAAPGPAPETATTTAWQIEHNGPWVYELGETRAGTYLLLAGPTDQEHQWSEVVDSERTFTSVPASVIVSAGGRGGGGLDGALAALADQRRAIRLPRPVEDTLPIVFNDYMNTLMGDPTTEKLLPLIDAAAEAGADGFCIDAGWYAEGHWWDTVGEWLPAASRFPGAGGLGAVIERIRDRGMIAGLWLEPEVIGVNSPLARTLPDEAFFSRGGVRIAEHGRHVLDLRHPAARAHLDEVVDRLVGEYGISFIKMDDNTMPGPGSDLDGLSPGAGLLGHARALTAWLDAVQARHPQLLIESCASGAMRMDYAMLARLHMQSTSDQQDPVMYAPIAAAAPASLLPEQAGHWAYPNPTMSHELFVLSLVNGVLGRMYLSGYLNTMTDAQRALVVEAVSAHRATLATVSRSHALWPLGLPNWEDEWVALGQDDGDDVLLTVWRRPDDGRGSRATSIDLPLPALRGRAVEVSAYFPTQLAPWTASWDESTGVLTATAPLDEPSARVLRLRRVG